MTSENISINSHSPFNNSHLKLFYVVSILFIALNSIFLANKFYWFTAFPLVLCILVLSVYAIDVLLLLIVFTTPLAINLKDIGLGGLGLSIPTEPLLFGVMLVFFLKLFLERGFDKKITTHPVTISIIFSLVWMGITTLSSTMFIVSLKHFIAQLWFISVFYFLGTQLFKNFVNIKRFIWLYAVPLVGVITYTIYSHYQYRFSEQSSHWVMSPFYNDHTAYAAVIAMFIPIMIGFAINKHYHNRTRFFALLFSFIFIVAIILSYTRAAWLSLAIALFVLLLFLLRIKFKILFAVFVLLAVSFYVFRTEIAIKLKKNRQDSSTEYTAHLKSMSNVSTDASNVERINRWNSAIRMFYAKPWLGWGPGTYSFKYAPFQHKNEMTVISTNAGNKGNAHSEYIGPLAESGILGTITFLLIVVFVIYKAAKLYVKTNDKEIRLIIMGVLLGLITYFVHGLLNNFLDTDKASIPFWGFIAILTALDVYHNNPDENHLRI